MNALRRPLVVLALVASATIVAACGGSASASPGGGGSTEPGASSEPGASTEPAASVDASTGGGSAPEGFEQSLVPPNSSVTLTQSAGETQTVIFHSTSSFDELKSFYESAVDETFKQEIEGSLTLGWGDSSAGTAGLVVIVPSAEGGIDVSVTTAIGG